VGASSGIAYLHGYIAPGPGPSSVLQLVAVKGLNRTFVNRCRVCIHAMHLDGGTIHMAKRCSTASASPTDRPTDRPNKADQNKRQGRERGNVLILRQVIVASWMPRKWGSREDGFKQGQFRGVNLDTRFEFVQQRGSDMPLAGRVAKLWSVLIRKKGKKGKLRRNFRGWDTYRWPPATPPGNLPGATARNVWRLPLGVSCLSHGRF